MYEEEVNERLFFFMYVFLNLTVRYIVSLNSTFFEVTIISTLDLLLS